MNKIERRKEILLTIPFFLIIIFSILMGYFSFIEAFKKARVVGIDEIARRADDLPPPIERDYSERVKIELEVISEIAEFDNGKTFEYWTYNRRVPGPFVRVRQGDIVEVQLTHIPKDSPMKGHSHDLSRVRSNPQDVHIKAGQGEHSVDFHAALGFMGGAELIKVAPGETKSFEFKTTRPGIYIYHCGSSHVPTHLARGMYGMILVEPEGGLPKVDKEYYVMQGELYTKGDFEDKGFQELSKKKLLREQPEYYIFNGRIGALKGDRALTSNTGETVRIFFGNSGQKISSFHIIGEIFDSVYTQGDLTSPPLKNVQTTLIPAGGAVVVEKTTEVPGVLHLVSHTLAKAIDRGAIGELIVSKEDRPDLIKTLE
ncbi:MAG: multicopper oxidase domain-containing protein [Candidatus Pacebacteria bacterium]|jgi:nitrite reductase (NO-forming)|nr:multicopper oxidase domain-containing protein [Candidatus Paceibacterota bacterium]|tara:strand:- start:3683 stop:4795 length:1113 start_codon:yes stop_codon:yes gene_type:complete